MVKKFMRKFLYLPQMAPLVSLDAETIPKRENGPTWTVLDDAPRNDEYDKLILSK